MFSFIFCDGLGQVTCTHGIRLTFYYYRKLDLEHLQVHYYEFMIKIDDIIIEMRAKETRESSVTQCDTR
jgi:hypothetical protein